MKAIDQVLRRVLKDRGIRARPYVVTDTARLEPDDVSVETDPQTTTARVRLRYGDAWAEEMIFDWADTHVTCIRRTRCTAAGGGRLKELGLALGGIRIHPTAADDYFYHAENPRIYDTMVLRVDTRRSSDMVQDSGYDVTAGNRWADPGVVSERIGASPYQPFPAVLVSNFNTRHGLVHGSLSQRVFFHNYLLRHEDDRIAWELLSSLKAVAWRDVACGETLTDRWYLGRTDHADDVEQVFADYTTVLRHHLPPLRGAKNANRHTVVWGSWNDGNSRDVDEERILKTAEYLQANLPTVEWVQLDAGYTALDDVGVQHGLGMPYEGEAGVDTEKFPQGLKHFTDEVRKRGLHPATWIGGVVTAKAPLVHDHPDWFIDYSYRIDTSRVLDVSRADVRAYMTRALDFYLVDAGYEGMKHDFWSYVFEDSGDFLAEHARSGYEWRTWWLSEVRRRLPEDGYLQTGCDIVMGNPFLGEFFNNYRYGIDIGGGHWDHVATNLLWGTACFALHIGDLIVPNSDSVAVLKDLPDNEVLFWINYCMISGSLVEIAGWLHLQADHPRMAWVKKSICCPNNGRDVHFAGYDYRARDAGAPAIWFIKTPHFSRRESNPCLPLRTVAFFNTGEDDLELRVTPEELGLRPGEYTCTDAWSLETEVLDSPLTVTLAPHSSRLLAVSTSTPRLQLLDADIEIADARARGDSLRLEVQHAGDATLVLSRPPRDVRFNRKPLEAEITARQGNSRVRVHVPGEGSLALRF